MINGTYDGLISIFRKFGLCILFQLRQGRIRHWTGGGGDRGTNLQNKNCRMQLL
jgi:hypothetical protein